MTKNWRNMFKFSKSNLSVLLALLSLNTMNPLMAEGEECCNPCGCNRLYVGAFGGENYSSSPRLVQRGTAFFLEDEGGPLDVDARGRSHRKSSGFGGAQLGYEWTQCPFYLGCSDWSLTPAAEVEAYFYRHTRRGSLINPTARLPEHDFVDSFPMHVGVYAVNGVLTLNSPCLGRFSPYIGGGVGAARVCIRRAKSKQISPPEPGINHFNSDRSDSAWTFAAQAKAGLRYNICEWIHIFGEYRFLYLESSRYIFGSTVAPTHAPTSTWNVDVKHTFYNAFAFGIQFDL